MRVAVVQLNSQADVAQNLAVIAGLVRRGAEAGARLLVLPENFAFMGESDEAKRTVAEDLDGAGPIMRALRGLAKEHSVHIVAGGMPERSADEARPFNTSVLLGPDGNTIARYRKVHLFDVDLPDGSSFRESGATTAGGERCVVDLGSFKLGMTVCYDLRFPELYRAMDAHVVTVPAAFTLVTGKDHWHVLLRARAIENQVYVLAAAQGGRHPRGRQTYGKSCIIDPWGDVIAQCAEGPNVAVADIDLEYLTRVRANLPCLTHRRM